MRVTRVRTIKTLDLGEVKGKKLSAEKFLGQEVEGGADEGQQRADDDEGPIEGLVGAGELVAEELEVEGTGQDDADGEAGDGAEQAHDGVELGDEDGEEDEDDGGEDAHGRLEDAAGEAGEAGEGGVGGEGAGVEAEEELEGADDGPRIERDLGERDDGDADDEEVADAFRVAWAGEDVARDLVLDAIAEHEDARDGHEEVEEEGEDVGDVDSSPVFVGVPHVAVDVGED
nr:hypothetical protein CFP56_34870 [Quercus suber]